MTPFGESQSAETDPLLQQGSIEAAVCSAANLDRGFKDEFHEEKDNSEDEDETNDKDDNEVKEVKEMEEVAYGEIKLESLLFQDDILTPNKSPESAQTANDKIERKKSWNLNYLIFTETKPVLLLLVQLKRGRNLKENLKGIL